VPEPNRRWATDLPTVWAERDGLCAATIVVDCGDRSALRLQVTKSRQAPTILAPVRSALREHSGVPTLVPSGLDLRTDHGPQYTGSDCEELCTQWGVQHTLAPVGRPTGNAVAERTIQTMKEERIWLADFTTLADLQAPLAAWRDTFNNRRPHQALKWQTPAARRAKRLAAPQKEAASRPPRRGISRRGQGQEALAGVLGAEPPAWSSTKGTAPPPTPSSGDASALT